MSGPEMGKCTDSGGTFDVKLRCSRKSETGKPFILSVLFSFRADKPGTGRPVRVVFPLELYDAKNCRERRKETSTCVFSVHIGETEFAFEPYIVFAGKDRVRSGDVGMLGHPPQRSKSLLTEGGANFEGFVNLAFLFLVVGGGHLLWVNYRYRGLLVDLRLMWHLIGDLVPPFCVAFVRFVLC
jgi:hypothetical protein